MDRKYAGVLSGQTGDRTLRSLGAPRGRALQPTPTKGSPRGSCCRWMRSGGCVTPTEPALTPVVVGLFLRLT